MKRYPDIPPATDAQPALFESGHLWIQEKIDGALVRFSLSDSGLIVFGDDRRVYERSEPSSPYAHAVEYVRERLDRESLLSGIDDPTSVVFFGEATHRHRIDYEFDRMPSFLGFDIYDGREGRFLPPDAVEGVFERLGLEAVNAFQRELPARHFELDSYEIPESEWYDGPAEGVVFRNKKGMRARLEHPEFPEFPNPDVDAETLTERWVTDERIAAAVATLEDTSLEYETVRERLAVELARKRHAHLEAVDRAAFRAALDDRVTEWFANRRK